MSDQQIHLLHMHRYWTEYLDFLFDDFPLCCSPLAPDPTFQGQKLPIFDPEKHKTIITAGRVWDKTKNNRLIIRFLHSPGFGTLPFLDAYASLSLFHKECDYRFLLPESAYRMIQLAGDLSEAHDFYRYQMLQDKRVSTLKVDPMLYKFIKAPKRKKRKLATGLITLNWNIVFEEGRHLDRLLHLLSKELTLSFVLHPLTFNHPEFIQAIKEHSQIKNVYFNLDRHQLIDLYDENEFIIFDGSGSGYEGMIRGCKPLLVDDLHYQQKNETLHAAMEAGYLPFQTYHEIKNYKTLDHEEMINEFYPFLLKYTEEEARGIAGEEVNQAIIDTYP